MNQLEVERVSTSSHSMYM